MRRPNLARERFENSRPVWVLGGLLTLIALVLSITTVVEVLGVHGVEQAQLKRVEQLEAQRLKLQQAVATSHRQLASIGWKKLQTEVETLQGVVARRQVSWSRMLADLERVVPWDVRLVSISPGFQKDGGMRLQLQAIAVSREAWLSLLARLFSDPQFSDPIPENEESPVSSGEQGYVVGLAVHYWPDGRP
jgi:Tfp pilus assembly protein PilN